MVLKKVLRTIWKQRYIISLLSVWSLLLFLSAIWNLHENYRGTYEKAKVEANTIFQHNLAYRRWNSMHGGVYAKVSEINQPNPYIVNPNRDVFGEKGVRLTMINPFQMTKQAYDLLKTQSPELAVLNRTVSLDPLNTENEPDEWETNALMGFENGEGAMSEITIIDGAPYMRLISPYVTETRCLGCHEHQGYSVGDIRGGMSIAVPMQPYLDAASSSRRIIVKTHLSLWLLGSAVIVFFFMGMRRFQSTIERNEEKFRIVSEFAYNVEYWINEKKKLAFISPSCERITGYSRKHFQQSPHLMFDMIHPDDKKMFKNHLVDFEEEAHDDLEYRIVTRDGEVRWLSHVCSPIYADGEFLGRRGSNRDITDKKLLQEDLQQAKKLEDLAHFAGGVAHDFNNVLTSIITLTHLVIDEVDEENGTVNEYIDNILNASKLGQNLTSNLLSLGRKRGTKLKKTTLNRIVGDIEPILRVLLRKDIACSKSLTDRERLVMVDQHQVGQILINLATNARDAMPGGGTIRIKTAAVSLQKEQKTMFGEVPAGDYMVLSVTDTGTGISEEDQKNIFEPFYSTKACSKGTGLGLAIVDAIIKQHHAFLDVDSAVGQGTTFQVFFPVLDGEEDETADSMPLLKNGGERKKSILVVDDDWYVRKSIQVFFEKKGFTVTAAGNGNEGVSLYREHREDIDLVILDVMLPGKNGRQVFDLLRKENPAVKALFISGSAEDVLAENGIMPDQLDFMAKPLDMELFAVKVSEMLAR